MFSGILKRERNWKALPIRGLEEFVKQLNAIVEKDPGAIIQVDVPLLIELNLQYMFHKPWWSMSRRKSRSSVSWTGTGSARKRPLNRLKAQLPIEEKVGYADFVIHNDGSLEETRRQVEELWQTLKKIQEEKTS